MKRLLFLTLLAACLPPGAGAQTPAQPEDGVSRVLRRLEAVLESGDPAGYTTLLTVKADRASAEDFIEAWLQPGVTRAVVHERARDVAQGIPIGNGYDIYVEVLLESGSMGRLASWYMEIRRDPEVTTGDDWRIQAVNFLTTVHGLYRLSLNTERQFAVTNLTISAEDLELRIPQGTAFLAEGGDGVTALVLLGRGDATFSPAPASEKGQVKIFGGSETLQTRFESLFLRFSPDEAENHMSSQAFRERPVDQRDLRRANLIFQENVGLSYNLDLGDLSPDVWSIIPRAGDFVAEILTARLHLSYIRFVNEPEDIRLFDRTKNHTISLYTSRDKLAARGPLFDEDDTAAYDIQSYDIDASFDPRREWMDAKARLVLKTHVPGVTTLSLALAQPLVIRSVFSPTLGHLLALRAGKNDVIVNVPPQPENTTLDLEFTYAGRLPAPPPDREAVAVAQDQPDLFAIEPEPSYLYSSQVYWYPRSQTSDYVTARLRLRVPREYASIASGELEDGFPKPVPPLEPRGPSWKEYLFTTSQPVRYLGWAISRFVHVGSASVAAEYAESPTLPVVTGVSYSQAELSFEAVPLQQSRTRDLTEPARNIFKFYASLLGDIPYKAFTLAVVESDRPGGHSPAYYAAVNQPPPATRVSWRSDPSYFEDYPEFFVAHEVAHQWWGQAVGWKNYHEQWLSEGFSQYFAALYAERFHEKDVFDGIVRQLARWTLRESDQGPVYLGSRLGHIQGDSRIFRALVYNKGAMVLHMLRRLLGDDAFFRGVRRFYITRRFQKASTEDFKAALQLETTRPLDRFFERWIYNDSLPRIRFSYQLEPAAVRVRFEQLDQVFDIPVTVTLQYANSRTSDVVVPVTEQVTDLRIPTNGSLRSVDVNRDDAAPAVFVK